MKTTFLCLLTCLLAFSASGQTPATTPIPGATASPFAATPAPVVTPTVPVAPTAPVVTPIPTPTVTPTATPGSSLTLTVSTSATPSADDAIDDMIEKKIRSHFDFSSDRHHSSSNNDDDMAWIAVPIVFITMFAIFGMPVLIVAVILYFSFSRNRAMHKTVRLMVEKGQPVPESLLNPPPVLRQRSDLRRSIKWMVWGVALMIFFGACSDWDGGSWSLGIIPFMIGVGYLIFWKLDLRQEPVIRQEPVVRQEPPPSPPV